MISLTKTKPAPAKTLGSKGVKALARRFSLSTWGDICRNPDCWDLASMTPAEADVAIHRALNPSLSASI